VSRHEYLVSRTLVQQDPPFYGLIMAAMRKADTPNRMKLQAMFPEQMEELKARYHAPGGYLLGEPGSLCPGAEDPRCKGKCTLRPEHGADVIVDPDCFR